MRISDWSSDVCSSDLFYGGSAAEPASFRYDNGSRIVVGGLDEPQRIMGSEVSIVLIDEAIEVTQRDIDMLRTRLRGAKPTAYPHYRMRSEEHTSELQSLMRISYAVFCLNKKNH